MERRVSLTDRADGVAGVELSPARHRRDGAEAARQRVDAIAARAMSVDERRRRVDVVERGSAVVVA